MAKTRLEKEQTISYLEDQVTSAKGAEVPLDDFKALNPSMNRPVIMAAGTPQILLPWDNAATFQRNLDAYNGARLASWTAWVAPSTMKPGDAARRVGMVESDFRSINSIPPNMLIKAGSSLLVTRSTLLDADVAPSVADHGQMSLAPDVVLKRSVVQARKGDTSASLSQRYGVSAANLAEWNPGLAAGGLRKGQSVVLFLPSRSAAPRAQARTPAPAAGARTPARTSTTKGAPRTSSPSTKAAAKPAAKAKR